MCVNSTFEAFIGLVFQLFRLFSCLWGDLGGFWTVHAALHTQAVLKYSTSSQTKPKVLFHSLDSSTWVQGKRSKVWLLWQLCNCRRCVCKRFELFWPEQDGYQGCPPTLSQQSEWSFCQHFWAKLKLASFFSLSCQWLDLVSFLCRYQLLTSHPRLQTGS